MRSPNPVRGRARQTPHCEQRREVPGRRFFASSPKTGNKISHGYSFVVSPFQYIGSRVMRLTKEVTSLRSEKERSCLVHTPPATPLHKSCPPGFEAGKLI
jgi:hypothetical protein